MIVERLSAICKQKKTNFKQLEIKAKIANGSIRRWDKSSPAIDKLLAVCSVLEVPLSAVVDDPYADSPLPTLPAPPPPVIANQSADWCGNPLSPLSINEKSLLLSFRELNRQGQTKVLTYIDDLLRNPENLAGDHPAQSVS